MRPDIEATIDTYCRCWRELTPDERAAQLAASCTDDVTYTDPGTSIAGRAALADHIERTMASRPGAHIERRTAIDRHHDVARFGWRLVLGDGGAGADSVDFVRLADDGRLAEIVGFFGPMTPR